MTAPQTATRLDVEAIRADFPILNRPLSGDRTLTFLDNAASTQVPRQVLDAFVGCYETSYSNVHRGIHTLSELATSLYEQAREKVKRFLNAALTEEIIFTSGTTDSINLVARAWGDASVGPGDEILLTHMEHHSNLVPWQQLAQRTGASLQFVPLTEDGRLDLEAFGRLLSEKTKLVGVVALSNVLGTINPIKELTAQAHEAGAVVLVDAAQSVPHLPTDVQDLKADFLAFSGHKTLAPGGVGVLYGRQELLQAMPPFRGGGSMISRVHWDRFTTAELPLKFEAGTPPIVPAIALGAAIDYLQQIGLETIAAHEHQLVQRALEGLEAVGGVRILGPGEEHRGGLVSFLLKNSRGRDIHPHDIAHLLDREGIAVRAGHHCTQPMHKMLGITASTRASFYLYNTEAEIDHLVEALDRVKSLFDRGRGVVL